MPTTNLTLRRPLFTRIWGVAASVLALGVLQSSATESGADVKKRNQALVQSRFDAWGAGTGSPFELLADDARWTIEGNTAASRTYPNKEAFMREVIRPFNARMRSPLKPNIRQIYTDGDTVIVLFDARGTARDDRPYVNTYAWFLQMRNGEIIRATAFFDAIEFNDLWARLAPAE